MVKPTARARPWPGTAVFHFKAPGITNMENDPNLPPLPEPIAEQNTPFGVWHLDTQYTVVCTWKETDDIVDVMLLAARDIPDHWLEECADGTVITAWHVAAVAGMFKQEDGGIIKSWKTVVLDDEGKTWASVGLLCFQSLGNITRDGCDPVWKPGTELRVRWLKKGKKPPAVYLEKA